MTSLFHKFARGFISEDSVREIFRFVYQMTSQEIDGKIAQWKLSAKYF